MKARGFLWRLKHRLGMVEPWVCPVCNRRVKLCPCPRCGSHEVEVVRGNGERDPVAELDRPEAIPACGAAPSDEGGE